jgi:organic hydroperoxide reductase OsmC/OhrA
MKSIETCPYPLLYKLGDTHAFSDPAIGSGDQIHIRVSARALEGMQKEACVQYGPTGTVWHMLCDEGPYLNGTDLAPFPLAFFTAGLAASYLSELLAVARHEGIPLDSVELVQDNYYGMDGSALRGTLQASALPVQVACSAKSSTSQEQLKQLLRTAVDGSPGTALLQGSHRGTFSLTKNGSPLELDGVQQSASPPPADPQALFGQVLPGEASTYAAGGIEKLQAAESVFGVEGGAGSSLHASQKRLLHVRAIATLREDGLKAIKVQLFKPIGGVFHFLSDDSKLAGGQERAPSGLAYMSAGIAFCYLTQLGRYAHIVKQQLRGYRVVQDNVFSLPGSLANGAEISAAAPDTHTFIDSDEPDEATRKLVQMGEQTCFLHAACQTDNPTQVNSRTL